MVFMFLLYNDVAFFVHTTLAKAFMFLTDSLGLLLYESSIVTSILYTRWHICGPWGWTDPQGVFWISISDGDDERIFWVWNFDSRIFLGRKNWQVFFFHVAVNSIWDFWGLILGQGIVLGFVWGPRDFFGVWFLPPFDHPHNLKSRVFPPFPLGTDNQVRTNCKSRGYA